MAASLQKVFTIKEFQGFIEQPENVDRMFELINGEVVEVSPSRTRNSELALIIASLVRPYCREHNLPCHVSGADGAYNILGNVIAPDFAYKATPMSDEYPDPVPPLWAVEVVSPTDKAPDIRDKRQIYLDARIQYWEIYPRSQSIDVYVPGQSVLTVGLEEVLDGGQVIPGFTLSVKELFETA